VCFLTIYESLRALFGDKISMDEIIKPNKTGQCFYRDENEQLLLAISYQDEDDVVTTTTIVIEETEEINK
jgi:hypothetical protein